MWNTTQPNGQPKRHLDISKSKSEFGFEAKISFEEGLAKIIAGIKMKEPTFKELNITIMTHVFAAGFD